MSASFRSRVAHALVLLTGAVPCCGRLVQADPSMRVAVHCCGASHWPKRTAGGISFTTKRSN